MYRPIPKSVGHPIRHPAPKIPLHPAEVLLLALNSGPRQMELPFEPDYDVADTAYAMVEKLEMIAPHKGATFVRQGIRFFAVYENPEK